MPILIRALAVAGLLLSAYSLHVETAKNDNGSFVAACDINAWISCSRVFASPFGRGFGLVAPILGKDHFLNLPNSVFGLAVYTVFFAAGELYTLNCGCLGFYSMARCVRTLQLFFNPSNFFGLGFRREFSVVFHLFISSGIKQLSGALFLLAIACCTGSFYLGYILVVVLQDVCVVCIATYIVNAGLFFATGNAVFNTGDEKKALRTRKDRKTN